MRASQKLFWYGIGFALVGCALAEHSSAGSSCYVQCKHRKVVVSLKAQRWCAECDGKIIRCGHISSGKPGHRTPTGTYNVILEGGPGCTSSRYPKPYGGAKMPWCMFFHRLYALHGYSSVPNHPASHGCVRLYPSDAKWLSQCFVSVGTRVHIH